MSLVLNVEILGEFKKLTDATKGSQKSLGNLEDTAKKISSGINKTLGLIGIGFSLNFLVDQFKESTKAAIEDEKSKTLLNNTLKENLGISDDVADSIDKQINKMQLATSVADDKLRPAYQKLALSTGDTTEAMELLAVAVDVAAGTGKDLDTVAQAMARALEGNDTALARLVPSVKGAKDPIAELAATFKGAAEEAAKTDPYAQLQIIFGELQEQIGYALLPILKDFSEWLSTPEGQEKMEAIVDGVVLMIQEFTKFVDYISQKVMPGLETLTGEKGFGAVITGMTNLVIGLGALKIAMSFMTAGHPVVAGIVAGIGLIIAAYSLLGSEIQEVIDKQGQIKGGVQLGSGSPIVAGGGKIGIIGRNDTGTGSSQGSTGEQGRGRSRLPSSDTNINVNINRATVSADDVADALNKKLLQQGSTLRIR